MVMTTETNNSKRLRRLLIQRILTLVCIKLEPNAVDKISERIKGEGYYVTTGPAALAESKKVVKGDDRSGFRVQTRR